MGVDVGRDGGGAVRVAVGLDRDALARVGDLRSQLRVDDLRRSGWAIVGPRREADGRTWVRGAKRFADAAGAARVVAEVTGTDGPFRAFRVARSSSFLRVRTTFRGTVDLRGGLESFGDARLREQLGGTSTGTSTADLERELGRALERVFSFRVDARLPGDVSANAPTVADGGAVWRPRLGERVVLVAEATSWRVRRVLGLGVAAVAALLLVLLLAGRARVRRARRVAGSP